ncbi:fimbrial protein [Burkholderia cepacia]|uniref:fimbrial protein n=1 Tax=Burkholderia cepacia TaxID=292 RepID=UPI000ACFFABB|nr:fimbrial protein [Burkholderia cepacia]
MFYRAGLIAAVFAISGGARAACLMTPTGGVASSAPIVLYIPAFQIGPFNPNVPIGSMLGGTTEATAFRVQLSTTGGKISCPEGLGGTSRVIQHRGKTAVVGKYTSVNGHVADIYATGVPGVGMIYRMVHMGGGALNYWPTDLSVRTNKEMTVFDKVGWFFNFIKTGPITAGGVLTGGEIGAWYGGSDGQQLASFRVSGGITILPQVPTCRVTTPSITVPLGNIPASTFAGVGTPSPSKPFNIVLECSGGNAGTYTNVYTTLTDHTNPGNVSDTLTLARDSIATGVGIQVLNGTTVIKYGPDSSATGNTNQWKAGTSGNGTFTIPLTARYVQTAPKITPGTANGLATFTMSYQ